MILWLFRTNYQNCFPASSICITLDERGTIPSSSRLPTCFLQSFWVSFRIRISFKRKIYHKNLRKIKSIKNDTFVSKNFITHILSNEFQNFIFWDWEVIYFEILNIHFDTANKFRCYFFIDSQLPQLHQHNNNSYDYEKGHCYLLKMRIVKKFSFREFPFGYELTHARNETWHLHRSFIYIILHLIFYAIYIMEICQ